MFVFSTGRLAVPTQDMDFERPATFLFCAGRGVANEKVQRQKKDVRFAGLAASNGRRRENEETHVTNFICMRYLLMDVLSKTMKRSIKKTVRRKDVKGK